MSIMKLPRVAWMALTSNLNVLLHLDQSNPKPKHQQFLLAYGTITTKKNQVHACAAILTSTHACFQLVDLTCHAVTMLMDKDNTTSNYRANKPAQPKLKIRAAVSSQGNICWRHLPTLSTLLNPLFFILPGLEFSSWPSCTYFLLCSVHSMTSLTIPLPLLLSHKRLNVTHPNISHSNSRWCYHNHSEFCFVFLRPTGWSTTPLYQAFDWLKSKHSLIASEALKLVKKYFKADIVIDKSEDCHRHYIYSNCL